MIVTRTLSNSKNYLLFTAFWIWSCTLLPPFSKKRYQREDGSLFQRISCAFIGLNQRLACKLEDKRQSLSTFETTTNDASIMSRSCSPNLWLGCNTRGKSITEDYPGRWCNYSSRDGAALTCQQIPKAGRELPSEWPTINIHFLLRAKAAAGNNGWK